MKNIPIKFRGNHFGRIVYGDAIRRNVDNKLHDYIVVDNSKTSSLRYIPLEVDPDSIVQLVGYDSEGNEVYEGDKLIRKNSADCIIASLESSIERMADFIKNNNFVREE